MGRNEGSPGSQNWVNFKETFFKRKDSLLEFSSYVNGFLFYNNKRCVNRAPETELHKTDDSVLWYLTYRVCCL